MVKVKSGGRELPIFELCFSLGTCSFSCATAFQMPSIEHSICEGWHLHVNKRMRSYGIRTARLLTVSRSIRRGGVSAWEGVCRGGCLPRGCGRHRPPMTRGRHYPPPSPWTHRHLWKHNLRKLRLRAVKIKLCERRLKRWFRLQFFGPRTRPKFSHVIQTLACMQWHTKRIMYCFTDQQERSLKTCFCKDLLFVSWPIYQKDSSNVISQKIHYELAFKFYIFITLLQEQPYRN